ncbi:MAG: hypothetical protein QF922_04385, partial [SAR324 cluster bacterium]|nr:hypothetical protein [SAR324 cluster bacterium]
PDQTIYSSQQFTSFDLDDYLTELDGDEVNWSYEIDSGVDVYGFVEPLTATSSSGARSLSHPQSRTGRGIFRD